MSQGVSRDEWDEAVGLWAQIMARWAQEPDSAVLDFGGAEVPPKVQRVLEAWFRPQQGPISGRITEYRRCLPEMVLDPHGRPRCMQDVDWALGEARRIALEAEEAQT